MSVFNEFESSVRIYCRSFPATFDRAKGAVMYTDTGKPYIDFFSGAGALNYGHNHEDIKSKVLSYLATDGVVHALDLHTTAKADFIDKFAQQILIPKKLPYKLQFCGPTGTNAVEAALKLARKIKKRQGIFSFSGGYHGLSLGSLSVSGNKANRSVAGTAFTNVTFMPFPHKFMSSFDTIQYMDEVLSDTHSGVEKPAAVILETVQAEGGVVVAPVAWLKELRNLCDRHEILLICDEIQVGCHRTGPFFSFERASIVPDIVVVSKSISGYGGPMSLVLMKRELDQWLPGEHAGTFRGNQLAIVGANATLDYLKKSEIVKDVYRQEKFLSEYLNDEIKSMHNGIAVRGIGMIWGIDLADCGGTEAASAIKKRCYDLGLLVESAGRSDAVIKIMPPLNIEKELLTEGCDILTQAFIDSGYKSFPAVAKQNS